MTKKHLFSRLLKKAVSMALWTKAGLCVKSSLLEQSLPRTPSRLKTSVISVNSVANNLFNLRNLRSINDLRSTKDYVRNYKKNMQNKANFRKSQMNISNYITMDYENKTLGQRGKKQSQTNPNKAKFKKAKMNVTSIITKGYENKPPIRVPKKQTQFSLTTKTNANLFTAKDYEKNRAFGFRKNKPKQSQSKPMLARHQCGGTEGIFSR